MGTQTKRFGTIGDLSLNESKRLQLQSTIDQKKVLKIVDGLVSLQPLMNWLKK